jgi:branched-chain amino acid transport system substrate-binding protein
MTLAARERRSESCGAKSVETWAWIAFAKGIRCPPRASPAGPACVAGRGTWGVPNPPGEPSMTETWRDETWAQDIWHRGKLTRRRVIGWGGGAIGAMMLVPAPWRAAFGAAKPYKIGSEQPLSGAGAAGGKTAVVGLQMAVDRINASGGINGRPIELVIADDSSSPAVARQKTEKMVQEDEIDLHVGGFLSNICLACMPVWEDAKIVNMISVCLDTTLTTTKCNRYSFRVHDYAPAQAVAFAPYLVKNLGKTWHIVYADYSWGQSTRDAYTQEIKKSGGEVVETTGIPLGTADMTPFLSKVSGDFDGLFAIFFAKDGITIANQAYDLGLSKKYRFAGDGSIAESTNLLAVGNKLDGFTGINRYIPVFDGPLNTPYLHRFFDEAKARLAKVDPSGPLPDKYVQSNYEAMNAVKIAMENSKFQGRDDTMKLIDALEGLEMKESDDFPQGDKTLRKEDHQAFLREFIFEIRGSTHHLLEVVPKEKTLVAPACKFQAA